MMLSDSSVANRTWLRFVRPVLAGAVVLTMAATMTVTGMLAAPARAASPDTGDTLRIALSKDLDTLNPFTAILASSTAILRFQYDTLVDYSVKDESVIPGLASKWKTSEDGKKWTFTMPEGRKWSDGKPLTAEDPAWTINAMMDNGKLKKANGSLIDNIKSVKAPDPTTLVITLDSPQASNPGAVLPIVPKHVWSTIDNPAKFDNDKNTVGSGPFIITKYNQGLGVSLKANKYFWRGKPDIPGLTYIPYRSADASVAALRSGEIDFVSDLTPAQFKALKEEDGITVNPGEGRRYTSVAINPGARDSNGKPLGNGDKILHNVKVRKAIVMGIDDKTLLKKVFSGLGTLATGEIPASYPKYHWDTDPEKLPLAFNPDRANKFLDEAGYKKDSDGIRHDKNGDPIELRLMGRASDPSHERMAKYIKGWLKDLGIAINVTMKSDAQVNDDSVLGRYDLYFTGWGIGPDPDFQLSINQCSSRPNADGSGPTSESNWCSPAFDKLFKKQHVELNQKKRSDLVVDAQKLIYHAAVNDVMLYANSLEAYRSDRFTGFVKEPAETGVISGQNGYFGFYLAKPVAASDDSGGGPGAMVWVIAGVVVVLLIIGGTVLVRRRRATQGERE